MEGGQNLHSLPPNLPTDTFKRNSTLTLRERAACICSSDSVNLSCRRDTHFVENPVFCSRWRTNTGWPDRKWRETKQQLIWWPDLALLGCCCLVSIHFLCDILSGRACPCSENPWRLTETEWVMEPRRWLLRFASPLLSLNMIVSNCGAASPGAA